MTGAELIVAQLAAQGIGSVFAVAGASHTWLLDALDRAGFAIVSSRHESGAVGAADGYARALADRRPVRVGVTLIVAEQGMANAVGGLAVAHALGVPPDRGLHISVQNLSLTRLERHAGGWQVICVNELPGY